MPNFEHDENILSTGQAAITTEVRGLQALEKSLSQEFIDAIRILENVQGRVIVSGMGKSGHIARKIAATLSSTGTPAFFVHPSEASHGDLGMVKKNDALIILSYSGETEELLNLVIYAQQNDIPLIAITHQPNSALAKSASVALILPKVEEACPMGLAPTTSTTMMLALGDALAVSLLELKKFTAHDYKILHPGGSLGRQLLHVRDLMHIGDSLPLVSEDALMQETLVEITQKTFGCVGVVNHKGALVGVITDGDLRRHMSSNLLEQKAKNVMTCNPYYIQANAFAIEALEFMREKKITSLFVLDQEKADDMAPLGIIHIHDILRAKIIS
ncbi:MAG: KpsF/GutQ family sugar-phosphate isomerase [Alphaproteobacteria bacterium]|nr:KpsF/GutQ family sugar-phosphate isomerase [Alphaproteobacteria bacterium]OJV46483.1 MAG: D-arabinose 5-phosphate [Alphaproteobacteria bacterium 43-37]